MMLVAWTRPLSAQPPAAECQAALKTLRTGATNDAREQFGALQTVNACGAPYLGQGVAAAATRRAAEPRSSELAEWFTHVQPDSAIFNAMDALAGRSDASPAVRVLSLLVLGELLAPTKMIGYARVAWTPPGGTCMYPAREFSLQPRGTSPADFAVRIRDRARSLQDPVHPAEVRSAANCMLNAWRQANGYLPMPLGGYNANLVAVSYVCGNRFIFTNPNPVGLKMEVRVAGVPAGGVWLRPKPAGSAADSEYPFEATTTGTVSLLYEGSVLKSAANGGTACP
jgi:hypothetical protein